MMYLLKITKNLKGVQPVYRDFRAGDVRHSLADINNAVTLLSYQPTHRIGEQRDVKGLYKKARAGLIANYTGISSPYEAPVNPALCLESGEAPLEECVERVIRLLREKEVISYGS